MNNIVLVSGVQQAVYINFVSCNFTEFFGRVFRVFYI